MNDIVNIELDDASIIYRSSEIEHERRVAISDLLDENKFSLKKSKITAPYKLFLSVKENRLRIKLNSETNENYEITLPISPFRSIIKDYFMICESYFNAVKLGNNHHIQTIDMARRGIHNDGSTLLNSLLDSEAAMDFNTARRLFTLICVLHVK